MPKEEGSTIFVEIFDAFESIRLSLFFLGLFIFLGTIEGSIEEYIHYMDKKSTTEEESSSQHLSSFLTKQMIAIFFFKKLRLLLMLVVLSTAYMSLLKVIINFVDGGFGSINWNTVVLMPSFMIYRTFTKLMPDVVNGTDEAASEVSKMHNTALRLSEWLITFISSIHEIRKNSTNNKDDSTQ
ncbi:hypothetical protein [Lysinibacillus capsici]|uniref:hypothetical protein n=1 Tax=Lysinibacillus capsici TaxID=2115968 RepID=UPI003D03E2AD